MTPPSTLPTRSRYHTDAPPPFLIPFYILFLFYFPFCLFACAAVASKRHALRPRLFSLSLSLSLSFSLRVSLLFSHSAAVSLPPPPTHTLAHARNAPHVLASPPHPLRPSPHVAPLCEFRMRRVCTPLFPPPPRALVPNTCLNNGNLSLSLTLSPPFPPSPLPCLQVFCRCNFCSQQQMAPLAYKPHPPLPFPSLTPPPSPLSLLDRTHSLSQFLSTPPPPSQAPRRHTQTKSPTKKKTKQKKSNARTKKPIQKKIRNKKKCTPHLRSPYPNRLSAPRTHTHTHATVSLQSWLYLQGLVANVCGQRQADKKTKRNESAKKKGDTRPPKKILDPLPHTTRL